MAHTNITTSESIDTIIDEMHNDPELHVNRANIIFPRFTPRLNFQINKLGQTWKLYNNSDQLTSLWMEIYNSELNIATPATRSTFRNRIIEFNGSDNLKNALNRFLTIPIAGGGSRHKSKRRNKRNKKTVKNRRKRRHN